MKIYALRLVAGVALLLFAFGASAQTRYGSVQYPVAIPTGSTGDFISKTSFRGLKFNFGTFIQPRLSIGLELGYQTFYQAMPKATYPTETGAITGYQYRYLHAVPVLIQPRYYFVAESKVQPYAGLGVGTYWLEETTELGLYAQVDKTWHFGLAPEVGVSFQASPQLRLNAAAQYNSAIRTAKQSGQQWLSLQFGVGYTF